MLGIKCTSWATKKIVQRSKRIQTRAKEKNVLELKASQKDSVCLEEIPAEVRYLVKKILA